MRNIIIILLLITANLAKSATYYVAASGGSDSNAGTIGSPWATWQKGFDVANAGDTVYFRAGTWQPTSEPILNPSAAHGNNGTYANPICFFNYPDEIPILDCSNYTSIVDKVGLDIKNATYIKFRGLTVRNCLQIVESQWISGISFYQVGVVWLDRMVSHDIMGYGTWIIEFDTLYMTNCDSYDNNSSNDVEPGNRSDGFTFGSGTATPDTANIMYMTGCRAWNNADDGFEVSPPCQVDYHNNWSFLNGYSEYGDGVGFKLAHGYVRVPAKRKIYNNLVAFNKGYGFGEQNLNYPYGPVYEFSNNTVYKCNIGFAASSGVFNCATHYAKEYLNNNLVYASRWYSAQTYPGACEGEPNYITLQTNTWIADDEIPYSVANPAVTVTNADFVLIDSTDGVAELTAARKADGSLPDITFLTLAETSDLIDAGTPVGIGYMGDAPDIGYAEYGEVDSTLTDILSFTVSDQVGTSTINKTAHTVTLTVRWYVDVTALSPTITLDYGATIFPLSGIARDFTSPVSYTVTALDEETIQEWTVTVTKAEAPKFMGVNGKFYKGSGKLLKFTE